MAEEAAKVHVKIIVDSNAQEETKKVSDDMKKMSDHAQKSGHEIGESMKHAAHEAHGFHQSFEHGMIIFEAYKYAFEKIVDLAGEPLAAFRALDNGVGEMAGSLAGIDQNGNSFVQLKDRAFEVREEVEQIARAAGTTDVALSEVFNTIISRGGHSVETATDLVKQFSIAGQAVPGGAKGLASAFSQVEMGMIRARNPIVQMIANTGVLQGNAKNVAKQMMAMAPDKQMELAEKAIARMSKKMASAPASVEQLKESMHGLAENLMESMGKSISESLQKTLQHIKNQFMNSDGSFTELSNKLLHGAQLFGDAIGRGMENAAYFFDGFLEGVHEFKTTFDEAYDNFFARGSNDVETWHKTMKEMGHALAESTAALVKVGSTLKDIFMWLEKTMLSTLGAVESILGNIPGIGMTSAGKTSRMNFAALQGAADNPERENILEMVRKKGTTADGWEQYQALTRNITGGMGMNGEADEITARYNKGYSDALDEFNKNRSIVDFATTQGRTEQDLAAGGNAATGIGRSEGATNYMGAFVDALGSTDDALASQVASVLRNNDALVDALGVKGPAMLDGSAEKFKEKLFSVLGDLGDTQSLGKLKEAWRVKVDPGKGAHVNFNGGQTFNIKQDFKDQDPDRIAVVFRNDIVKHAIFRTSSNIPTPSNRSGAF